MQDRYGSVVEKVCSQNTVRAVGTQLLSHFMLSDRKCTTRTSDFRRGHEKGEGRGARRGPLPHPGCGAYSVLLKSRRFGVPLGLPVMTLAVELLVSHEEIVDVDALP